MVWQLRIEFEGVYYHILSRGKELQGYPDPPFLAFGHDVEHTVGVEKAIGHNTMHMGMPAAIIAEGVDSHNRTEDAILNFGNGC